MDGDVEFLIKTVERTFGVAFDSTEMTDDSSIDDLCCAIRARLGPRTTDQCFTSVVFWRLRRACVQLFGVSKQSLAPRTSLDLVLPTMHRRRAWKALGQASGLELPALEYSRALGLAIFAASFFPSAILALAIHSVVWGAASAIVAMPASSILLFALLKPFASTLPSQSLILGDAAKTAVGLNYSKLVQEFGPSTDRELAEAIRYVIADVTDLDPKELVTENPRLVDLVLANDGLRAGV